MSFKIHLPPLLQSMSPISFWFPFLWGQRFCHKIILCTCNLYVKGQTILYFPRSILGFLVNLPQSPTCAHSHFLLIYSFLIFLHPVYHLLVLVRLANTVHTRNSLFCFLITLLFNSFSHFLPAPRNFSPLVFYFSHYPAPFPCLVFLRVIPQTGNVLSSCYQSLCFLSAHSLGDLTEFQRFTVCWWLSDLQFQPKSLPWAIISYILPAISISSMCV